MALAGTRTTAPYDAQRGLVRDLASACARTIGYLKPASPIGDDALIGNLKPAAPRRKAPMLGLPDATRACLFDLDGVLTQTAKVHATAWKQMFDAFLAARAARTGEAFVPFDVLADYDEYVDGMPRYDGVRSFLASRGIELPEGTSDDQPQAETIAGLGNRKNELVLSLIHGQGVETYEGSIRYVRAVREAGLRRAVVSSSANTKEVLAAAGIEDLFEARIDAITAELEGLKGKPAPDYFLAAARALTVPPAQAAVFEDALAGVAAGRAGGFGFVVGVDRTGQAGALREHGADLVVSDLARLLEPA
jgi:beta-phosphoglucomutase family hydrolase